jgi:hypothetical protein
LQERGGEGKEGGQDGWERGLGLEQQKKKKTRAAALTAACLWLLEPVSELHYNEKRKFAT